MTTSYRPEIDGLRAVAIGAVLVFHAWPRSIQGGFVGVDVFFVISGYLITGLILDRLQAGTFRFADFYARRARRLFPALALVLAAVLVTGALVALPWDYARVGRRVAAAAAFAGNLSVLADQTGYFAPMPGERPLLHLWSLGVEEQFYLAWPLLLVWLVSRRHALERSMVLAGATSLALAIAWTAVAPTSAFYVPFTRFWELLAGAWVVARERRGAPAPSAPLADLVVAAGLALIAFVTWRATSAWPAWVPSLLAVIAAGGIIWAGASSRLAARVLAHPVAVWIGLVSYPLYLWHWPVQNLTLWPGAFVNAPVTRIGMSMAAAAVTYYLWERPWRRWAAGSPGVMAITAFLIAIGAVGAAVWISGGLPQRLPPDVRPIFTIAPVDGAWRTGQCFLDFPRRPGGDFDASCLTPTDGRPIVALWGDSHAAQFAPGLREAAEARGVFLAQWTVAGCAPLPGAPAYPECVAFRRRLPERIAATQPATVILAGVWSEPTPRMLAWLGEAVTDLRRRGVPDVAVAGRSPFWPTIGLLFRHYRSTGAVPGRLAPGPDLDAARTFDAAAAPVVAQAGGRYVPIVDPFCDATTCPTLVGTPPAPLSTDGDHLTPAGSRVFGARLIGR